MGSWIRFLQFKLTSMSWKTNLENIFLSLKAVVECVKIGRSCNTIKLSYLTKRHHFLCLVLHRCCRCRWSDFWTMDLPHHSSWLSRKKWKLKTNWRRKWVKSCFQDCARFFEFVLRAGVHVTDGSWAGPLAHLILPSVWLWIRLRVFGLEYCLKPFVFYTQ